MLFLRSDVIEFLFDFLLRSSVRLAQTVSKTVASEANGLGSTPSCATNFASELMVAANRFRCSFSSK